MKKNNYQGALQIPIDSGFDAISTASDVIRGIDLSGKNAVVTGGYAGIGLETVKALVSAGANVIVPARDTKKAKKNLEGIANVQVEPMDLMNPDSIDAFAQNFIASDKPLHLLINNAGIMWVPLQRDQRGFESQLSTNYLGHFQLTARLWNSLLKANGARVLNVSSWGHHYSPFDFEDPNFQKREYESFAAYGQSKTASILFTLELDNKGQKDGIRAYSIHPGIIVETELNRHVPREQLRSFGVFDENDKPIVDSEKGLKSPSQGASTTIWCATSPKLNNVGGVYCEDSEIAVLDNPQANDSEKGKDDTIKMRGIAPFALDEAAAKKLWIMTEGLIGVKFPN